ncbi:hypothetical protein [Allofournierella sp.]|uniref:hypothetical protein n=1 Tax=Allofournierella sp. TaxID=1940256 RepID=UPI003AF126EC
MKKTLTEAEVKKMFEREAVLIDRGDAVPKYRAIALFGSKATNYASRPGVTSNSFGIGDYDLSYLNLKGFIMAASFYNVERIREEIEGEKTTNE